MNVFVEITEVRNGLGNIVAVEPRSSVRVDLDGQWSIPSLERFKKKLDALLVAELPGCLLNGGER